MALRNQFKWKNTGNSFNSWWHGPPGKAGNRSAFSEYLERADVQLRDRGTAPLPFPSLSCPLTPILHLPGLPACLLPMPGTWEPRMGASGLFSSACTCSWFHSPRHLIFLLFTMFPGALPLCFEVRDGISSVFWVHSAPVWGPGLQQVIADEEPGHLWRCWALVLKAAGILQRTESRTRTCLAPSFRKMIFRADLMGGWERVKPDFTGKTGPQSSSETLRSACVWGSEHLCILGKQTNAYTAQPTPSQAGSGCSND